MGLVVSSSSHPIPLIHPPAFILVLQVNLSACLCVFLHAQYVFVSCFAQANSILASRGGAPSPRSSAVLMLLLLLSLPQLLLLLFVAAPAHVAPTHVAPASAAAPAPARLLACWFACAFACEVLALPVSLVGVT